MKLNTAQNMFFTVAALAICVIGARMSNAQTPQVASVVHFQHTIESRVLGEKRTILVHLPAGYSKPDTRFPVLYMTDAHAPQNAMIAGIVDQQAWGGLIPELIVVGIQNVDRSRDLTPTDDGKGGRVGGAAKFLEFIEKEVVPLVESTYRTAPYRVFAGHSLGGLFAVYALVERPDLFNAFIAASPVLGWDKDYVIKRAADLFKQDRDLKKTIFVSVGDEPDFYAGFNSFQDLLKKSKTKDLEFEFRKFPGENHASVLLPAYYAGLRKIFEGWGPPMSGTVESLDRHYAELSKRFGYKILVPEEMLNRAAYALLNANRVDEALAAFRRNVANYPNSANVYDSLGDAYEKNGQLKLAAENFEKAYKLAEAAGEGALAAESKRKLERVRSKN